MEQHSWSLRIGSLTSTTGLLGASSRTAIDGTRSNLGDVPGYRDLATGASLAFSSPWLFFVINGALYLLYGFLRVISRPRSRAFGR